MAQLTDVGRKRPHNEDNMAYVIPKDGQVMAKKGALFIVADGMGGHAAGEVASEIAVDTVTNTYYQQEDNDDIPISLMNAIRRANALIHQRAAENMLRSGMGTTCVSAVLRGNMAYVANVGDSRAYLVRHGQVRQISQDHSWVEEQVRAGLLTKDQARSHGQRNVITRSLGTQPDVEVDVFAEQLEDGDSLILCTDGLSGSVNEEELRSIVDQYMPQESVYHLVERANENGGPDNITAIVVRVLEAGWEPPNARRPVHVGGREADEDTAIIGKVPTAILGVPGYMEDGRSAGSTLRLSTSEPLYSSGSAIAPQASPLPQRKRRRVLYPTLALCILFIIAVVGTGTYYFFNTAVSTGTLLSDASTLISQANAEATSNAPDALQKLAHAQSNLRTVQNDTAITSDQRSQLESLQSRFSAVSRTAIAAYDTQGSIATLPCTTTTQAAVNNAGTVQASSLTTIIGAANATFSYALGTDGNIYYVNAQHALVDKQTFNAAAPVVLLTSDSTHLYAITKTAQAGKAFKYTLYALIENQAGTLKQTATPVAINIPTAGQVPAFVTVAQTSLYVVLTSTSAAANQATILDYNTASLPTAPKSQTISISVSLLSVVAWPQNQLFLLDTTGRIQSLMFSGTPAQDVRVQNPPILTPLATNSQNFTASTPLPTPATSQTPQILSVPGAAFLVAGTVTTTPHLYIVDNTNHRIIDLVNATEAVTPAATSTPVPASKTAATTKAPGGKAVDTTAGVVSMRFVRQYASSSVLASMKSVVVDPKTPQLTLLTLQAEQPTQVSINLTQVCTPTA